MKDDGRLLLFDSSPMVIWSAPVTMPPVGVDCLMGSWGDWSACSKNCGGGVQTRNRSIITPSNEGGNACGQTVDTRPCNTEPCPDCAFNWSPFGQCVTQNPATGAGKKQSQLMVSSPSGPGGQVCPDPNSNIADCVNCVFSPWEPAGELASQACNQTTGIKSQSRAITVPASAGGSCTEPLNRQEACPVDCQLNPWGGWSACENKVNGVGKNTRRTTVQYQPKNGGRACPQTCDANGNCTETQTCGDCVVGTTYTLGNCDPATGRASRTRVGDQEPTNGGGACPGKDDTVACDIGCQISGWSDFSACDITSGKKARTRTVTQQPKNNGTACPALTETVNCDIDCDVSGWSAWGDCDKPCGPGTQKRTRTVTREKKNSGKACPALTESQSCTTRSCGPNGDTLLVPGEMTPGDALRNGTWTFNMQSDGNLVLYDGGAAKWALQTVNVPWYNPGRKLTNSTDATKVVDPSGGTAYTLPKPSSAVKEMKLQSDGKVVINGVAAGSSVVAVAPQEVTLYEHCNYQGTSKAFGVGYYSWIVNAGFPNDILSALKIPAGLSITLYEHANYQGRILTLMGPQDVSCLVNQGFNDITSSFKIYKTPK